MIHDFQLTNSRRSGGTVTTTRRFEGEAESKTLEIVYSSDNDSNDAAIIAAGVARIGDRPLRSLTPLAEFLAELEAEEDTA